MECNREQKLLDEIGAEALENSGFEEEAADALNRDHKETEEHAE